MPKVKERINEMARTMCGHQNNKCPMHHDADCSHIGPVDCLYKQYATALFRAGYVHISDEENIIAQVKKQAQIDVLNKLKRRAWQGYQIGMYIVSTQEIDELIKEVGNENRTRTNRTNNVYV